MVDFQKNASESTQLYMYTWWKERQRERGDGDLPHNYAWSRNVRVPTLHDPTTVRLWESFMLIRLKRSDMSDLSLFLAFFPSKFAY